ncbi:hypothetical protein C1645_24095 [Glomus cerebriforme]|uniref:Uncharacterized protein n=1 Tax=Glomus cerebriforme TaxID=658196 RepID=A0A397TA18_9GLOM|nr:hypothetical protein C1645_24095 [Glomus cerebriforme]
MASLIYDWKRKRTDENPTDDDNNKLTPKSTEFTNIPYTNGNNTLYDTNGRAHVASPTLETDILSDEERMVDDDEELEFFAQETIRNDGEKWVVCDIDLRDTLTKWQKAKVRPRTDILRHYKHNTRFK